MDPDIKTKLTANNFKQQTSDNMKEMSQHLKDSMRVLHICILH